MISQYLDVIQAITKDNGKPTLYLETFIAGIVDIANGTTVTTDSNVNGDFFVWYIDATIGNVSATLPAAVDSKSRWFFIKRKDNSGNTASVVSSDLIDGAGSLNFLQYEGAWVVSDGSTWNILSKV